MWKMLDILYEYGGLRSNRQLTPSGGQGLELVQNLQFY